MDYPLWIGSPEERIIREKKYAKEAGTKASKAGKVIEDLVTRELTKLAAEHTDHDVRFSRGWIVEDYGKDDNSGASWQNASKVNTAGIPRLDIICYQGDVARKYHGNVPHALVPQSYAYGFIEVKKFLNQTRLHEGSSESSKPVNQQLEEQKQHIESLELSISQVLLGIEYSEGPEMQIREEANADFVGLIECLKYNYAEEMANEGELKNVLDWLTPFPLER